jgi:uncharacterized protein
MRWLPLFSVLFIAIFLLAPVSALDKLTGFVNDEAGVISPEYKQMLNDELYNLKLNTSVEMAVATVKSLNGTPIEEYSLNLAHNTLGEKGKDNGLLILLAVDDREYRIEVGYGLEGVIPDVIASRIGRNIMAPSFKQGDYGKGLYDGVRAISEILRNDTSAETEASLSTQSNGVPFSFLLWIAVFLFFVLPIIINTIKSYKKAKKEGKNNDKDILAAIIVANMFGRGRGGGGFGGGGFGGGGGGFGGFGGGGFGGGGAGGHF